LSKQSTRILYESSILQLAIQCEPLLPLYRILGALNLLNDHDIKELAHFIPEESSFITRQGIIYSLPQSMQVIIDQFTAPPTAHLCDEVTSVTPRLPSLLITNEAQVNTAPSFSQRVVEKMRTKLLMYITD
jgi:hypothetical protein